MPDFDPTESDGIKELRTLVRPGPKFPVTLRLGYQEIKSLVGAVRRILGKKDPVKHTWKDLRDNPTGRKKEQE